MNDIAFLELQNGGFTLVDPDIFPVLNKFKWYGDARGYISRYMNSPSQPRKHVSLCRTINQTPFGMCTDHINNAPIDNRRNNLRNATKSQNSANIKKYRQRGSKYKGVSVIPQLWRCRIFVQKKEYCSYHRTEREAAEQYNILAKKFFGEFAQLNELENENVAN